MDFRPLVQVDGAAGAEADVVVAGRNEGGHRLQAIVLAGLADGQGRGLVEQLGQHGGHAGWHVLAEQVRGGGVRHEIGEDDAQRLGPPVDEPMTTRR